MSWQRGAQLHGIPRLRALAAATLAAFVIVSIQQPAPAAAASPRSSADRVIAVAMTERGRPWVYGASGPSAFDCSGLVIYSFRRTHHLGAIAGGHARSGSAMLRWARAHHRTTSQGRRGDIAVWGNGSHVGIYLGNGKAISTLTSGVRVHGLRALTTRFTTFIRTGLSGPATVGTASAGATAKPKAHAKASANAKVVARRTVAVAALNLRSAPRFGAGIRRVLHRGTSVAVVRSARDSAGRTWFRVVVGSRSGWVLARLTRPAH